MRPAGPTTCAHGKSRNAMRSKLSLRTHAEPGEDLSTEPHVNRRLRSRASGRAACVNVGAIHRHDVHEQPRGIRATGKLGRGNCKC